jgi:YVTN family beta-propeller protein
MRKRGLLGCFLFLFVASFCPNLQATTVVCEASIGSGGPAGVVVDNNGNAWVAFDSGNYVLEISPTSCGQVAKVTVGNTPIGLAFDGTNIWVTNYKSNTVTVINANSASVVASYAVGSEPRGIVFDGTYIWVANYGSNTVSKLNPSNGALLGNFAVGTGPYSLAVDTANSTIWVANRNSNNVMALNQSGVIQHTVSTGSEPQFLTFDGTNMWVSCYSAEKVDEISSSGSLLKSVSVSSHGNPTGLTWDPSDGLIWGVTWGGYTFSLNPSTSAVTYYYQGGHNLYDMIFDTSDRFFWVTDNQDGIVIELVP